MVYRLMLISESAKNQILKLDRALRHEIYQKLMKVARIRKENYEAYEIERLSPHLYRLNHKGLRIYFGNEDKGCINIIEIKRTDN